MINSVCRSKYYIGVGIAIGVVIGIGAVLGFAVGNIGTLIAIGAAAGVAVGASLAHRTRRDGRG